MLKRCTAKQLRQGLWHLVINHIVSANNIYPAIISLLLLSSFANGADYSALGKRITDFELSVTEFESAHGRYSRLLTEPLTQLATAQINANRFDDADATLDRAIQITRINHGLFARQQYDLLQLEVENNSQRGDWEAVNQELNHLDWLYTKRYEGKLDRLVNRVMWLSDAHAQAAFNDDLANRAAHLILATKFNEQAMVLSQVLGDTQSLAYAEVLYALAHKYFIEARGIQNGGTTSYQLRTLPGNKNQVVKRKQALQTRFDLGLEKLLMMGEVLGDSDVFNTEAEALAELYIADWKLLFSRSENTVAEYADVYQSLLRTGVDKAKLATLFGSPALLPRPALQVNINAAIADISASTLDDPRQQWTRVEPTADNRFLAHIQCTELSNPYFGLVHELLPQVLPIHRFKDNGLIRVALTIDPALPYRGWISSQFVTRLGMASEIAVIEQVGSTETTINRAMNRLKTLQFRPALADGVPVAEQIIMDYRFRDRQSQPDAVLLSTR